MTVLFPKRRKKGSFETNEKIEKFRQKKNKKETKDFKRLLNDFLVSSLYILCYDDDSDESDDDFFHRFGAKSDATGGFIHQLKKTNLVGEIPDV